MIYPHHIRLRGPWECEPLEISGPAAPPGRIVLPCSWESGPLALVTVPVRFRRRFGYPGQLDADDRVWLTFTGIEGTTSITLNGSRLTPESGLTPATEMDVTELLQPRNELTLDVQRPASVGLWGQVGMDIRKPAYLAHLSASVEREGQMLRVRVEGVVKGTGPETLELYTIFGRRPAGYATVNTLPADKRFAIVGEELPLSDLPDPLPEVVQIDLVDRSLVWFRAGVAWSS